MSTTALVWCTVFAILCLLSLRRAAWGFALFSLTNFALPDAWWWGEPLRGELRWNLSAGIIYTIAVLIDLFRRNLDLAPTARWCLCILFFYAVNASAVHFLSASDPEHSWLGLVMIWKNVGLSILMFVSIRDKFDLKIAGWSIILGVTFVAFMVIFEDEGRHQRGRLEDLPMSLAADSNAFGPLFGFAILVAGGILIFGRFVERLVAFCCLPLMCEVLIRGNSRSTFLALCAAAAVIVLMMKGKARIVAVVMCLLGGAAFVVIMSEGQQEQVFGRFSTTFNAAEERDESAASRLEFWRLGVEMISDYPTGSGFQAAFHSPRGLPYLQGIGVDKDMSVHNAFLDNIAGWGFQGFLLFATAYALAFRRLRKTIFITRRRGQVTNGFFGACLVGGVTVLLVAAVFGGSLDKEWFIWWMAMVFAFANIVDMEYAEDDEVEYDDP